VSPSMRAAGRPLKVLHVDDDPLNLRVVQEILAAFGHAAVSCASGRAGLERLAGEAFDAILLDVHMPEMSGLEVLEHIRSGPEPARSTPVIALTADIISRRPQEYIALGFDDFVSKPILVAGLMAALTRATSARAPAALRQAAG